MSVAAPSAQDQRGRKDWPYPGSRWWRFDFHAHTPASLDTDWAIHNEKLSPRDWLLKYMAAEVDCVAVTDHNTGAWVDRLKEACAEMRDEAGKGQAPAGFRPIAIFPGVELSVQAGFHLLAIFDPQKSTADIDRLLGAVDYVGTRGDSDGVTRKSGAETVRAIGAAEGLAIPAHADKTGKTGKALLAVRDGGRQSQLDTNTVRQVLGENQILAVEWLEPLSLYPECVATRAQRLAQVLGSDCHSFQGSGGPGSRFTWVKMASPTIEGLRLALHDGNQFSVRRSDDDPELRPFTTPRHFITQIAIEDARFMGNRSAQNLELTPLFNGLIGGRGTGKSTIVHGLRLAYRREPELARLGETSEPKRVFERFCEVPKTRGGQGGLRDTTQICVEVMRDGRRHRLHYRPNGQGDVVEECDACGAWTRSSDQTVDAERFPIRIFSQGQIAALAGDGRRALLDIIDDGAGVADLHRRLEATRREYRTKCARLRELEGRIDGKPAIERKLGDVVAQLATFEGRQHVDVFRAHQRARGQEREVNAAIEQLGSMPARIESLASELLLDDWRENVFDPQADADALAWRGRLDAVVAQAQSALRQAAAALRASSESVPDDSSLASWRQRSERALADYASLQTALAEQGVSAPGDFDRLVQERHQIEAELKKLQANERDREVVQGEIHQTMGRVQQARAALSAQREAFLQRTLDGNAFVQIELIRYGDDPRAIEDSLRELLELPDGRFAADVYQPEDSGLDRGIAHEIATAPDRLAAIGAVKARLLAMDGGFSAKLRRHLQEKLEQKPELRDHVQCWFPDDDLRIKYRRGADATEWQAISQGSQGQRSAALLAFLLSFGDEPLVLDQPEDDLDNHLIYDLIVRQIRANKLRRQFIIATHNANVLVNGDAELVHVFDFGHGQCKVDTSGALQQDTVRDEVCRVMEGGRDAFARRWARLGSEEGM